MRSLFESVLFGPRIILRNRVFMAPLTRNRADADGVASKLAVQYYAQRASRSMPEAHSCNGIGNENRYEELTRSCHTIEPS